MDAVGKREIELWPDDAPLDDEWQWLRLAHGEPNKGFDKFSHHIGAEDHLEYMLLAGLKVSHRRRELEAGGEECVLWRERVVTVNVTVVLQNNLIPVQVCAWGQETGSR